MRNKIEANICRNIKADVNTNFAVEFAKSDKLDKYLYGNAQ